jgi:hypothetical protein
MFAQFLVCRKVLINMAAAEILFYYVETLDGSTARHPVRFNIISRMWCQMVSERRDQAFKPFLIHGKVDNRRFSEERYTAYLILYSNNNSISTYFLQERAKGIICNSYKFHLVALIPV